MLSLVLVLASDQRERAPAPSGALDMIEERVLASVCDPDFAGACLLDSRSKLVPIRVVGDRARTRIQPEANAVSGSAKRRDQRSEIALGGANTISPGSLLRLASVAGLSSPSFTPKLSYSAQHPASAPWR